MQTRFRGAVPVLALLSTTLPTLTVAQGLPGGVGDVGLTFGFNEVNDFSDKATVGFAVIDGSYSFAVGSGVLLGFDASYRFDDLASDSEFEDDENPESQSTLGAHLLWDLGADTRLGGFAAYGDTKAQNVPSGDNYDYFLIGVEARHFFSDDLMGYAQIGLGDKGRDGEDEDEGFNDGKVLRLGATYFMGDRSAFTLDFEYASADPYIDGDDAGRFFGLTASGETRIAQAPLMATYFVRYDHIDSTSEGDDVEELQVGLGIRYVFGAGSSREAARAGRSIGTPYLPGRASAWTEFLD